MPTAGEPAIGATRPQRTLLPIILWSAGIVLALALLWLAASTWVSVRETNKVLLEVRFLPFISGGPGPEIILWPKEAVERLGGRERAAARLRLYLFLPDKLAPRVIEAIQLLRYCGRSGVPVLARVLLHGSDRDHRIWAARSLQQLGKDAAEAIPALEAASKDPDKFVRDYAAAALATIRRELAEPPEPGR